MILAVCVSWLINFSALITYSGPRDWTSVGLFFVLGLVLYFLVLGFLEVVI